MARLKVTPSPYQEYRGMGGKGIAEAFEGLKVQAA